MTSPVVVDASALIEAALVNRPRHGAVVAALHQHRHRLVVPPLCVGEACHLLGKAAGWEVEAKFLAGLTSIPVAQIEPEDLLRSAELVRQYHDFPLGGIDSSIVALAERLQADTIMTLDRRHFQAVRPRHCEFFRLLPEF